MAIKLNRAVLAHPWFTGISRHHLAALVEELAHPWEVAVEDHRNQVRGGSRKRAAGAGARHRLVFVGRLVATLIHLRHDLPHAVLGLLFGVDRCTITRAVGQIRTLLAERGYAVPNRPGVRLRTLEDVFAYAHAEGVELRLDATEIQVRRPRAGRGGLRAFVSGKKKQNTMKATVVADHHGRTLWTDAMRLRQTRTCWSSQLTSGTCMPSCSPARAPLLTARASSARSRMASLVDLACRSVVRSMGSWQARVRSSQIMPGAVVGRSGVMVTRPRFGRWWLFHRAQWPTTDSNPPWWARHRIG
ncbi:transposase family protein [Nocardiopsis sp. NPDC058631]|uniref:helix-turn-helix domain-containing protein n=1 Tax=Nocardiopsis sp. NPDC058631 TaxID=3346566 RepID=UPI003668D63D